MIARFLSLPLLLIPLSYLPAADSPFDNADKGPKPLKAITVAAKVLGWTLSNTMDGALCKRALADAVAQSRSLPKTMNTDQGSQFTSEEWTGEVSRLGIAISMNGKMRWMDNVFIERIWRSVKYEEIYPKEHSTLPALETGLRQWFNRYNTSPPHQALGNETPLQAYEYRSKEVMAVAKGLKRAA